ncbi:hypothetical protein NW762_010588 [Fusarium torreyae]|uniref:GPI inositol-deacylase winged helix domain-containing protein n=1 Tax=Fusarium torreyae TaxID=1237075 RepID=A0A9W8RRI4_9HYPO|nr:hypothetical protein NW762_010588 [Fusarium torreyae]
MHRINGQMPGWKVLAHKVLSWITHAKRDLTIEELRHALAISTAKCQLDDGDFYHVDDMVAACAGLVTLDKTSNIIRFIHYTTQEYFNEWPEELHLMTEKDIAKACVSYLSFDSFARYERWAFDFPFYSYAAKNWGHHARTSLISCVELARFFSKEVLVQASVLELMRGIYRPMRVTKLHLATYFGTATVVQEMLENELGADPSDDIGRTPLSYAANHGHELVILLLLGKGAKVDQASTSLKYKVGGRTPLSYAAEHGHKVATRILIDNGADLNSSCNTVDQGRWTPLHFAVDQGHVAIVQLLLERGAACADSYGTALPLAVSRGHKAIIHLLLEDGANIESRSHRGQTSL